jgi:hypothetical protein
VAAHDQQRSTDRHPDLTRTVGDRCLYEPMTSSLSQPISGTATGVPFTALPPPDDVANAPMVVIWHLMDSPCTDAAMAAALPMAALPAWRLYLGLPLTGRRLPAGGFDELMRLGYADAVLNLFGPILSQAAGEAPAAVAAVRAEFGIADGAIGVAGAVAANERGYNIHYEWTDASRAIADRFDFLRRAAEIAAVAPALLVVSGEDDDVEFRADAEALERAAHTGEGACQQGGENHRQPLPCGADPRRVMLVLRPVGRDYVS